MAKSIFLIGCLLWISFPLSAYQSNDLSPERKKLQEVYTAEIGIRENTGNNDGAGPKKYLDFCGLSEGYEWCSAFVSWCFNKANIKALKTAWSPAWYKQEHVIYKKGWDKPKRMPQAGDVVLYYVPYKKRIGHVGFLDKYGSKYCETVEGNTKIAGVEGVHRIKRYRASFHSIVNYID